MNADLIEALGLLIGIPLFAGCGVALGVIWWDGWSVYRETRKRLSGADND